MAVEVKNFNYDKKKARTQLLDYLRGRPGKTKAYDRGLPANGRWTKTLFGLLNIGTMVLFYRYDNERERLLPLIDPCDDYSDSSAVEWWQKVRYQLIGYLGTHRDSAPTI